MPTKEEDFKQRFVAVLQDLRDDGTSDPEAIWLIGSLAATLIDKGGAGSWADLKQRLTRSGYDGLLRDFEVSGNNFHREGRGKHAYAVQVLAVSLVARTQQDPDLQTGSKLLDQLIESAVRVYRKSLGPQTVG
jgi:hypothetical protein